MAVQKMSRKRTPEIRLNRGQAEGAEARDVRVPLPPACKNCSLSGMEAIAEARTGREVMAEQPSLKARRFAQRCDPFEPDSETTTGTCAAWRQRVAEVYDEEFNRKFIGN